MHNLPSSLLHVYMVCLCIRIYYSSFTVTQKSPVISNLSRGIYELCTSPDQYNTLNTCCNQTWEELINLFTSTENIATTV